MFVYKYLLSDDEVSDMLQNVLLESIHIDLVLY